MAVVASAAALCWPLAAGAFTGLPIPEALVSLAQPTGQQRLLESGYRQAYWPLAAYFETQKNQAYCSVASSVIALNALGVPRPQTRQYPDYPFFTQDSFFAGVPADLATPAQVAREGMTLGQLSQALAAAFALRVQALHASDMSLETFRQALQTHLRHDDRVLLVNFDRKPLGQQGGGHWSPLAAYHEASDTALVLDVARYKYPPLWVPVADLYAGALSVDLVSGRSRGLVLIQKP